MTNPTEIQFHGTNGWFDSDVACTSCITLHHGNTICMFDAGTGIRRLDPNAVRDKHLFIFLSHLHLDHCVGLHFLQRFRPKSITMIIPHELVSSLKVLLSAPFTRGFSQSPYPVTIQGVSLGEYRQDGLCFSTYDLLHSTPVYGYRLTIGEKLFTYCVDTKVCPGVSNAASGADVFVCDCGLGPGESSTSRQHMTPEEALCIAARANVGRLVLTHFGCTRYTSAEARLQLLPLSDGYSVELVVAHDGMRLEL